jgi:hypothetical protein
MQVCDPVTWESLPVLAPTIQWVPLYFPTSDGKWTTEYIWVRTRDFVWLSFPAQETAQ